MRQLVELRRSYESFQKVNTEIICVFREDKLGVKGLEKSRQKTKATFPLVLDLNNRVTPRYTRYTNYVIDQKGRIRAVLAGTKGKRASAENLLLAVKRIKD